MNQPLPANAPEPGYIRGLNAPQREAVLTAEGPVLVLAGAGTGKTVEIPYVRDGAAGVARLTLREYI